MLKRLMIDDDNNNNDGDDFDVYTTTWEIPAIWLA